MKDRPYIVVLIVFSTLFATMGCSKKEETTGPSGPSVEWVQKNLNLGYLDKRFSSIKIGDCDWDGKQEIYCTTMDNNEICQVRKSESGWVMNVIASHSIEYGRGLLIGDGDGCGKNEIYFSYKEIICQSKWNGTSWNTAEIENAGYMNWYSVIDVGDGDGDGVQELYGIYNGNIWQFKCTNSQWTKNVVDSSGYWWNLAIGDGNNDGVPELYSIFEYDLYQLKRVGISWQKSKVMRTNCTSNLFIGDGDGDGLNEVYCGDASGLGDVYVSRFKWDGSHWSVVNLGNAMYHDYSSDYMFVSAGDSHNDGSNEIYALLGGRVYEVTDQGKTWITSYGYFAIGDADNDGANEIYCAIASERTIYQLRWQ